MRRIAGAALGVAMMLSGATAQEVPMFTGVAVYEASLPPDKTPPGFVLRGQVTETTTFNCEEVVTMTGIDLVGQQEGASEFRMSLSADIRERPEGASFRAETMLGGLLSEQVVGEAHRDGDDLVVTRTLPERVTFRRPGVALTGTVLTRRLVETLGRGALELSVPTVDYTAQPDVDPWTTVVARPEVPAVPAALVPLGFERLKRWSVTATYTNGPFSPTAEIIGTEEGTFYENGFFERSRLNFALAEIALTPKAVTPIPPTPCAD